MIQLQQDKVTRKTRGTLVEDENLQPNIYQVGTVYAVLADIVDFTDGFVLVRCQRVSHASINGVYFERCSDKSDHDQLFRETTEVGKIAMESVHTTLLSIQVVSLDEKLYSVDRLEIEEVLFSINS